MLSKLFPLIDYLYIYQLLEYNSKDFLKWFFKHPLKRKLQRKSRIDWTPKIVAISFIASFLMLILATFFSLILFAGNVWGLLLIYLIFEAISPFFIIFSSFLLSPYESYKKKKLKKKAKEKLRKLENLKVIAIVGSFAKTSTKNMLYTLLWKDFNVIKTPKSFNTELAISRAILSDLKETTDIFIVEMDAYHPGEIKELADIVKPDVAVITSIAPQHLERFGDMESLAKTQFEIAESLRHSGKQRLHLNQQKTGSWTSSSTALSSSLPKGQDDGILFLNSTSEWIMKLKDDYKEVNQVLYGKDKDNEFYISALSQTSLGIHFTLHTKKEAVKITLPVFGTHNALNFLAAASVAVKLGLPLKTIQQRASLILPTEHRLEVRKLNGLKLIDNSYNTNSEVTKSSLKLLKDLAGSQKIVITPGLIELGDQSFIENMNFAKKISKVADEVIIVGENAKEALLKGLTDSSFPEEKTHLVKSTKNALDLLAKTAHQDAVVLLENDLPDQYF